MKTLLGLVVLFLSAHLYSTEIISACYTEESYEENAREKYRNPLNLMNEMRAEYSVKHQIANMHELKYDYELEKEARKMKTCAELKHGSNYRIARYKQDESVAVRDEFEKPSVKELHLSYSMYLEPLMTAFIRCNLTATCEFPFGNRTFRHRATFIDIYGYRGTFSVSDFQRGPPGSKCTHGKTEKDLCIAPPRSEMETGGATGSGQESKESNIGAVNSMVSYLFIALTIVFFK
ncbi:hypothetical protein CRE_26634 [Caenorhabditis remanei]|uniref:Uncharacterized protein n=1 Tax=Caenorhabditis remanei TaxID=31234 RepID=E3MKY9_CAERE|nr:hypothetical protein CRE_26634 [Caenorhabditis remanei]